MKVTLWADGPVKLMWSLVFISVLGPMRLMRHTTPVGVLVSLNLQNQRTRWGLGLSQHKKPFNGPRLRWVELLGGTKIIKWWPIKLRALHRNERCHSCPHPPSSYEWRRVQRRQLSFWRNTLNLIGHHCGVSLTRDNWFSLKALLIFDSLRPTWSFRSLQQHIVLWSDTRCLLL